jgi:sugar phosphate isomerase/epimerase
MSNDAPRFLATCWTSGGNIMPARTGEYSPQPVDRRIRAVSEAGYTGFGINYADMTVVHDTIGFAKMRRLLDIAGIEDVELEYIDDWWLGGERREISDRVRALLFEAARELGARHVKAGLGQVGDVFERERVYDEFDELARQALQSGTRIALEPAAFSMTPTITPAAQMVGELSNPGGGLLVDIWHIYRSGQSYEEMAEILPAEQIFAVELNDGASDPVGSLYEDTFDNRLYAGEGVFDVPRFVRTIRDLGYQGPWGLEMMSEQYRQLTPEKGTRNVIQAARRCF